MGSPIEPPKSETKENPILEKDATKGGAPSNIIILGVLISVAIGIIIIIFKHFKKNKKSDDALKTGMSHPPEASVEDATPQPEQKQIEPDTPEHEDVAQRFSN